MRVLLLMDPFIRVPPATYGGIERVIDDLGHGLVKRGHQVALWAGPGSNSAGDLWTFGEEGEWTRWSNLRNTFQVSARLLAQRQQFDVVHNFGRLAYLLAIMRCDLPKVQTYMRTVDPANIRATIRLGAKRMHFTAVSAAIRQTGLPGGGDWSVIYNCAPVSQYQFAATTDPRTAPLVFLGRLDRCKGAHHAITVARNLHRPLIIAGTISPLKHEQDYFDQELKPRIDGDLVRYIGPVDNVQKNQLLGNAAAMLLPIEWEEPFPVVLPEAMLCGTPVIAFRRGGVPEGIDHGRTGFLCDKVDEMTGLVSQLPSLDRGVCRAEAIRRYSDDAIVGEYENLYGRLLSRPATP